MMTRYKIDTLDALTRISDALDQIHLRIIELKSLIVLESERKKASEKAIKTRKQKYSK